MAHTFLIFDYGIDETRAQEARHKLEGWKQAFRLDKKLLVKFERSDAEENDGPDKPDSKDAADGKDSKNDKHDKTAADAPRGKSKKKRTRTTDQSGARIRLLVRLDFSDHEKLSYQRWLDRVPADEHFKSASPKIVRPGESDFSKTSELFDSLD